MADYTDYRIGFEGLNDEIRVDELPVEGFIHKLKLVKRQGYGKAGFDLLKARMIAA